MVRLRVKPRAIVFDMDNTLLQSHIDYAAMKADVYAFLVGSGVLAKDTSMAANTTSTLIQLAKENGIAADDLDEVWRIAAKHETAGMIGAGLEPGALEMLQALRADGGYWLALLTNNARAAADRALRETGVVACFDAVFGREDVPIMKPSPEAVLAVVRSKPEFRLEEWLAVGDSWIDGASATGAGVPFVAYRADLTQLEERGLQPVAAISDWQEFLALLVTAGE